MKLLIASDIHGSARCCKALTERIAEEKPDRVILLGDLLYHGPRNDLPGEYDTKAVAEMLNSIKPAPLCVRGNCDSEVDQMMLHFPIQSTYSSLQLEEKNTAVFFTHGHLIDSLLPLLKFYENKTVLLFGHTHIPECTEEDGIVMMNPGSTSIPKLNSDNSYMTYENGVFSWKLLFSGMMYREYAL